MNENKTTRQNRVREALGRLYDQEPPYFREYLRRFEEDPTSRVFAPLAEAYRRLGRLDEAIAICREGLGHHPDFHGGRVALAKCFIDKKAYAEARSELERVVSAAPENLLAQRLLGDACVLLADKPRALHHYKMALLLSPGDVALAEKVHALEQDDGWELEEANAAGDAEPADDASVVEIDESAGPSSSPAPEPAEEPESPLWPAPTPVPTREEREEVSLEGDPPALVPEPPDVAEAAAAPPEAPEAPESADLAAILGAGAEDEAFKIEHVSRIFEEESPGRAREITTATLGDLYFNQGQYDQALRIFERLNLGTPSPDLVRKINACRARLGVDHEALVRNRQIETLRGVLVKVRARRS